MQDQEQREQKWSEKAYNPHKSDTCESERVRTKDWGGRASDHAAALRKSQPSGERWCKDCP